MTGEGGHIVQFDNVGLRYGTDREVLSDVSFTLFPGSFYFLTGASGAGKTSLLRLLYLAQRPSRGVIRMFGTDVITVPRARLPAFRRRIGVVFQDFRLVPHLSAFDNVALPLRVSGVPEGEIRKPVADMLTWVGLDQRADARPATLSGGEQQRVAIARAVAYQPEVLIMDEPFAAVDAQTRADLEDLVRRLHLDRGMSILFVTHDIDESVYLGERVVVLSKSPTWVQEDIAIDLDADRDQITTRALPRFTELRTHIYEQIQRAKRGQAVRPG